MMQPDSIPIVYGWIQSVVMRTPTTAEIVQLVIASLGSLSSLSWVISAAHARTLIIMSGRNGGLLLVASGNFRQELLRMMTHLLVLYFGWRRLWLPAFEAPYTELGIELRVVLVLVTLGLFLMGLFEWCDRRALDYYDRRVLAKARLRKEIEVEIAATTPVTTPPVVSASAVVVEDTALRIADAQERAEAQVKASQIQGTAADTQERAAVKREIPLL